MSANENKVQIADPKIETLCVPAFENESQLLISKEIFCMYAMRKWIKIADSQNKRHSSCLYVRRVQISDIQNERLLACQCYAIFAFQICQFIKKSFCLNSYTNILFVFEQYDSSTTTHRRITTIYIFLTLLAWALKALFSIVCPGNFHMPVCTCRAYFL
jgi:predicted XRE-type DNA-binding protein